MAAPLSPAGFALPPASVSSNPANIARSARNNLDPSQVYFGGLNHEAAEEKSMPTKLLMVALVTVSMAACTKEKAIVWQKPAGEELVADQYSCENYMRQNGYYGGRLLGAIKRRDFCIPCMESHGYTGAGAVRRQRLGTDGLANAKQP
jgi:hypothetical protein